MNLILVFIGGGIGAVLRYLLQLVIGKADGNSFPMATFMANLIGCLAIGILAGMFQKYKFSDTYNLFIITGILGGFTTFSSFGLEFMQLISNKFFLLAIWYCLLTNILGLGLALGGFYFTRY